MSPALFTDSCRNIKASPFSSWVSADTPSGFQLLRLVLARRSRWWHRIIGIGQLDCLIRNFRCGADRRAWRDHPYTLVLLKPLLSVVPVALVTVVVMPIMPMMPIVVIIVAVTRIVIRRPVIEGRNANSEIYVHSSLSLTR